MKYEDVQRLRTKYRQDPEVINVEYMRDVAVRCGNFKKAFELQERLEDIWFNYLMWSSDPFVFSFIILTHDSFHKNR